MYERNSLYGLHLINRKFKQIALGNALEEYHAIPAGRETKRIIADHSFIRFLNNLFQIHSLQSKLHN